MGESYHNLVILDYVIHVYCFYYTMW